MISFEIKLQQLSKDVRHSQQVVATFEEILNYAIRKRPGLKVQISLEDLGIAGDAFIKSKINLLTKEKLIDEIQPFDANQHDPILSINDQSSICVSSEKHTFACKNDQIAILQDCSEYIVELKAHLFESLKLARLPQIELIDNSHLEIECFGNSLHVIKCVEEYLNTIKYIKIRQECQNLRNYLLQLQKRPYVYMLRMEPHRFILYGRSSEWSNFLSKIEPFEQRKVRLHSFFVFPLAILPGIRQWALGEKELVIEPWIENDYEENQDGEEFVIMGKADDVQFVYELIIDQFKLYEKSSGPILQVDITLDQFETFPIHSFFQELEKPFSEIHPADQSVRELEKVGIYNNFIGPLIAFSYVALMLVGIFAILTLVYKEGQVDQTTAKYNFQDNFIRRLVTMELMQEAKKVNHSKKLNCCIVYFVYARTSKQTLEIASKIKRFFQIETETFHDPLMARFFNNLSFDIIQELEVRHHAQIDIHKEEIILRANQTKMAQLRKEMTEMCLSIERKVEYFEFSSRLAFNIFKHYYAEKIEELEKSGTITFGNPPRVAIRSTSKYIQHIWDTLNSIQEEIQRKLIVRPLSVVRNTEENPKACIKEIEDQHPIVQIELRNWEGGQVNCHFHFKREKSCVKLCTGTPIQFNDLQPQLRVLENAILVTFVGSESDWVKELAKSNFFILKDSTVRTSFYSKEVYKQKVLEQAQKNKLSQKDSKGSQKKQHLEQKDPILLTLITVNYLQEEDEDNFFHYFDKLHLARTFYETIKQIVEEQKGEKLFIHVIQHPDQMKSLEQLIKEQNLSPQVFLFNDGSQFNDLLDLLEREGYQQNRKKQQLEAKAKQHMILKGYDLGLLQEIETELISRL